MCAIKKFLSRLFDIESPLTHSNTSRSGITSANVKIIIADVDSTLNVETLLVDGQHSTIHFSMFATASSFAFMVYHSLWPCRTCAISRSVLTTSPRSSRSFAFQSVLGAFCCVLQRHILHSSRVWGSSFSLNEGYNFTVRVSSTMAALMLSRHRSLFLESLLAGCTRGYASCVHRESSVSPQHELPRAAVSFQHALPRAAGGLLVLQRRTPLPRAARVGRCHHNCSGR